MNSQELVSLGVNWCLTTRKKSIKRSDVLEILSQFNDKHIFPLFYILIDIEYILDKYERFEET